MTFKVTRTVTRNSTTTPFYLYKADSLAYIVEKYDTTNKRIKFTVHETSDSLQRISVTEWVDESAYNEFKNDETLNAMVADGIAYNTIHNITSETITESI